MKSIDEIFKNYFDRRVDECNCRSPDLNDLLEFENRLGRGMIQPSMHLGKVTSDEMPLWNAAIGFATGTRFSLAGGAVILSDAIAISSWHILKEFTSEIPDDLCLHLGANHLDRGRNVRILDILDSALLSEYDIALFVFEPDSSGELERRILGICDPDEFDAMQKVEDYCLVAGFGYTKFGEAGSSRTLMDLAMRLGPCNAVPSYPLPTLFRVVSCNGGGPCEKDSGSGLFVIGSSGTPLLAGIMSRLASGRFSCHTAGYPALYSNISAIKSEIDRVINGLS